VGVCQGNIFNLAAVIVDQEKLLRQKQLLLHITHLISLPLRVILRPEQVRKLDLKPIADERLEIVLKHTNGKLLDIGCGENRLVQAYGQGIGVDVYPWSGIDGLIDSIRLPFKDNSFNTITFMACLNHIPERQKVLLEARRVLTDDGQILITMIDPVISYIGHKYLFGWRDPDIQERGMKPGEVWGFWPDEIRLLLEQAGLELVERASFVYGLNNLYIAHKK
jgi:SAM-dependent methyltransferase